MYFFTHLFKVKDSKALRPTAVLLCLAGASHVVEGSEGRRSAGVIIISGTEAAGI